MTIDRIKNSLVDELKHYKNFNPFFDDDGWFIIFPGEEDGRRPMNKHIAAITFCQISLKSSDDVITCLRTLVNSNIRLETLNPKLDFDRRRIKVNNTTLRFSIAWYNLKLFIESKNKWKNKTHTSIFKTFNAKPTEFIIEHIII
ncbi:hypothetical protein [Winogradskyella sp.]|uniref:hypothetical protein n=1 Tax=Winogradskyella sp. TaxID=1883156 RepID=UPI0026030454|nr:hypothetical protein [Winogradskyella sp.]